MEAETHSLTHIQKPCLINLLLLEAHAPRIRRSAMITRDGHKHTAADNADVRMTVWREQDVSQIPLFCGKYGLSQTQHERRGESTSVCTVAP